MLLNEFTNKILSTGLHSTEDQALKNKIRLANRLAFYNSLVTAVYIPLFYMLGLPLFGLGGFIIILGYCLAIYLNKIGRHFASRIVICVWPVIIVTGYSMGLGPSVGAYYLFFGTIMIPPLLFSIIKERIGSILVALHFAALLFTSIVYKEAYVDVPENIALILKTGMLVAAAIAQLFALYSLSNTNKKIQDELASKNNVLAAAITEQEDLITQVRGQNQQLEQFAHIVAHDLKAPLVNVGSLAGLIAKIIEEKGGDESVNKTVSLLINTTKTMQETINSILLMSKEINPEDSYSVVSAEQFLKKCLERVDHKGLEHRITTAVAQMEVDSKRLERVLENLLSNAVKYNDKEDKAWVAVSLSERTDSYIIQVSDNGIGIAEENKEKVFTLYENLGKKNIIESTGIGLSIVNAMLRKNGGAISIESELGIGTTFSLQWMKKGFTNPMMS